MCKEWHEFEKFQEWALTHNYANNKTLDRVSNNIGYGPNNCRWLTRKGQAYNRRTNVRYTINGRTRTLTEWCNDIGIRADVAIHRMESGWPMEKALTTPKRKYKGV